MKRVEDLELLGSLLKNFPITKTSLTNNYLSKQDYIDFIEKGLLYYINTVSNICFFVCKYNSYRLYYIINNPNEQIELLDRENFVIEVLFRNNILPEEHINYWQNSGFHLHLQRDLYEVKSNDIIFRNIDKKSIVITNNVNLSDAKKIKCIFDCNFDPFTGDYITEDELVKIVNDRLLYIAYVDNRPIAGLHFYTNKNTAWLGHIAVDTNFWGQGIASLLLEKWIQDFIIKVNRFSLWVQSSNNSAIKLYKSIGMNYIGKSTISMLKLK